MTRTLLMLQAMAAGLLAGCAGPGALPPSAVAPVGENGPAMSQFTSTPIAGLPECKQYSATATVGGKPQPLTGEACRQPDGSWHIAEQPAGGTVLYQTIYWPPAGDIAYDACFDGPYVAGPYVAPCLYDFPFGFSVGFPGYKTYSRWLSSRRSSSNSWPISPILPKHRALRNSYIQMCTVCATWPTHKNFSAQSLWSWRLTQSTRQPTCLKVWICFAR